MTACRKQFSPLTLGVLETEFLSLGLVEPAVIYRRPSDFLYIERWTLTFKRNKVIYLIKPSHRVPPWVTWHLGLTDVGLWS